MRASRGRVVVFDLDETLGCFVELGMFWDALKTVIPDVISKEHFFKVMNMYPEFIRPKIINILEFLKQKKIDGICSGVMIYTNNNGDRSWSENIAAYFNETLNYELFDQVIAAFRVKGKIIETCRTSHSKSVDDFLRCTSLPIETSLCFVDDQYHPLMEKDSVYYINVKPFFASMSFSEMANRYYDSEKPSFPKQQFVSNIVSFMNGYAYDPVIVPDAEKRVDVVVTKQLLVHIKNFMRKSFVKNTRRRNYRKKTIGTRKHRTNTNQNNT